MTRSSEARFWQAVGAAVGIGGGFLLAYTFGRYGLASIDHKAIEYGVAGSFVVTAGVAAYLAGRALHVEETQLTPRESSLWNLLSAVCIIGGGATVVFAKAQHSALILDRLATGLGGAFVMMVGVLCMVGQRVMSHMHDVLVVQKDSPAGQTEEKAKAASASSLFHRN